MERVRSLQRRLEVERMQVRRRGREGRRSEEEERGEEEGEGLLE
jgi:hypothetical protein